MFEYIWIYWNIFEYIRITYYSYSYSVIFSDRIIFVFVFGGNFLTNSIRIRIRWKIFDEYYSYSYSVKKNWRIIFVFVFGIFFWTNTIRIRIRSSKNYSLTSGPQLRIEDRILTLKSLLPSQFTRETNQNGDKS